MSQSRRKPESKPIRLKSQHFSDEAWSDLVRGHLKPSLREAMRQHLADGCRKCQRLSAIWADVAKVAGREPSYNPPDYVLRVAKGQFGINHVLPWTAGVAKMARMVFDSLAGPLPAGVRALAAGPRQLIYQVGEYFLDVKLDHETGSRKLSLIGQIRDSQDPAKQMADSPVLLLRGQDRLAQTTTNVFGEFHLEFDRKDNLWLAIGIQGEAGIVVPLERALRSSPVDSGRLQYES